LKKTQSQSQGDVQGKFKIYNEALILHCCMSPVVMYSWVQSSNHYQARILHMCRKSRPGFCRTHTLSIRQNAAVIKSLPHNDVKILAGNYYFHFTDRELKQRETKQARLHGNAQENNRVNF